MAFTLYRTRRTISGQVPGVRADIDVRTGGEQIARAVSGIGGAMANLGLRWDLMEASTQLNEAQMKAEQEHNRLMLELPDLEPSEHAKAYEKSLKVQQSLTPENKRAASAYGQYLNDFTARRDKSVTDATKAKLKDNKRAVGFIMQQEAIQTGNTKKYFTHLEEGKLLGVYDAEEVVKYKQATIDGRERYVKLQTAEQLEQLEIQREEDRDTISKLIRAGQSADSIIEGSSLDEKEQFTWFERQRTETERRLKGEAIVTDRTVLRRLESLAYDVGKGAITEAEFKNELDNARYPEKGSPSINDNQFTAIATLAEKQFESYQSEAMDIRERYALVQLVTLPSEEAFAEMLARLTSKFEKEQAQTLRQLQFDNLDQYKKALRDWLKENKDANADEIYIEGRRLLTHYRKTPDQLRLEHQKVFDVGVLGIATAGVDISAIEEPIKFSFNLDRLNRVFRSLTPEKKRLFKSTWERAKKAGVTEEKFLEEWNK